MGAWTLADNALAVVILVVAIILLLVLVAYVVYEYRKRRSNLGAEGGEGAENSLCDTNKEIVVYHQGVPVTLRLIQTPSGVYCRILDECQEVLLAEKAETVAVIDRVEHLCIGSNEFDRAYAAAASKYAQAESLRGLIFSFSVVTVTGGGVLLNSTAEPYAEAELTGADGLLRVYSRNRRRTAMLSVEWRFGGADGKWKPFGIIYDTNGCPKYELKLKVNKSKKSHSYALFHAPDKKAPSRSESEFLKIKGQFRVTTWAASHSGMSKTDKLFRVFARAVDGDRRIQIASIEPAIDAGNGSAGGLAPPPAEAGGRRGSVLAVSNAFTNAVGDQLYAVKYKSHVVDPETKSAILGAAFLLCLRHCMKDLYTVFERIALAKS